MVEVVQQEEEVVQFKQLRNLNQRIQLMVKLELQIKEKLFSKNMDINLWLNIICVVI